MKKAIALITLMILLVSGGLAQPTAEEIKDSWDVKSKYRGLHTKYMHQLEWLKDFYPKKIKKLEKIINPDADLVAKIARLRDKYETTLKEISYRQSGDFVREPHGTIYYIDLDAGNDGADGLAIGTAWLKLEQYTSVTARTPGDIAKIRANTSEAAAGNINCDEDGDGDNYIYIIGCSSTDDPWSDASDVKPVISFGDTTNKLDFASNNYWRIERIVLKENTNLYGGLRTYQAYHIYIKDCEFTDNPTAVTGSGTCVYESFSITYDGCIFKDNIFRNLYVTIGSTVQLISCIFDGGAVTTDYGLYVGGLGVSQVEAIDTDFGQNTAHDIQDIYIATDGGIVKTRNCKLDKATVSVNELGGGVFSEDDDATYGANLITYYHGTVTKDTGVTRVGGASSSAKMEPNANCGLYNPLTLNSDSIVDAAFKIWLPGGAQKTVTIYIRSFGVWGTYPTNTELYTVASYLDHAANATRTEVASTAVLADETTWVAFTMTFTPLQDGFVYVNVYMAHFEAAKGCYVDIKPVIS